MECITIGHFTELIVNVNKIMTEIKLLKEGRWEVIVNGKNTDFLALNLVNKFDLKRKSVDLICDTVQKLEYCDGVPDDNYKVDITIFRMCHKLAMRIVIGLDIKLSIANIFCYFLPITSAAPCFSFNITEKF